MMMGKTVTRREHTRRVMAAAQTYPANPVKLWQVIAAPLIVLLVWFAVTASGATADVSSIVLADWKWFVGARVTVILVCGMALFVVRGHNALITVGMLLTTAGLTLRIGVTQTLGEPLTLGFALLLLALVTIPIGVIIRPNAADKQRAVMARNTFLEQENVELRQRAQVSESKLRGARRGYGD